MKIKPIWLALIILIIIFGGIGLAQVTNLWNTSFSGGGGGGGGGNGQNGIVAVGDYKPDEIRGSFSFAQVASGFDITPEVLLTAFGLPSDLDPANIRTKDLENLYAESGVDVGNGSMKIFVALYKGLPIELDFNNYLPRTAVEAIQKTNPNLSTDQVAFLQSNVIDFQPTMERP